MSCFLRPLLILKQIELPTLIAWFSKITYSNPNPIDKKVHSNPHKVGQITENNFKVRCK